MFQYLYTKQGRGQTSSLFDLITDKICLGCHVSTIKLFVEACIKDKEPIGTKLSVGSIVK